MYGKRKKSDKLVDVSIVTDSSKASRRISEMNQKAAENSNLVRTDHGQE